MVKYPDDWKVVPLGEVCCKIRNGFGYDFRQHGKYPISRIETISSGLIDRARVGWLVEPPPEEYKLQAGDILYSHINSLSYIGNVAQYCGGEDLYHGMNLMLLRSDARIIDAKYLCYILKSDFMRDLARKTAKLAINQASINTKELSAFPVPLPPLPEQKGIAAVLGNVDKLIDNLSRQLEKKRLVKQGVMQDLLTGKKRLPGFTGEWENGTLRGKVNCLRGVSYSGSHDVFAEESDRTIRLLRSNNIQEARFVDYDVQFINRLCASEEQMLREDDIMVCMANGSKELVGKSCYFDKRLNALYTFGAFMACLRARTSEVCMSYVFQLLNSKSYWENIALALSGSSINNLRPGDILDMSFSWPTLAEQKAIAKVLGDMDVEIAKLEAKCKKYRHLKQGLMNDLLTGKVRIK